MPVKKEPSGRRSVEAEVEVSGTPEQVWQAIASGPGISSWFVPTTLEGRVGGSTVSSFAPDHAMDSKATITEWNPPHRFVAEDIQQGLGTVGTEWTVEAQDGGTCKVRVVHSWFAETDDWDGQFEGHSFGWLAFFAILRLYLEHFPGQPCTLVQLAATSMSPVPDAWDELLRPLALSGASVGDTVQTPEDAPTLRGVVEVVNPPQFPGMILRLQKPAPALAHFFTMPIGGPVMLPVRFYLYGNEGGSLAQPIEADWQAWLAARFAPFPPGQ